MTSVFDRFREERVRLGLSQADVAERSAVHLVTARRWEKATPVPVDKLALLADLGMDIQYIVTGVRSENLQRVQEIRDAGGTYAPGSADYTEDEIELLRWYRALPEEEQGRAFTVIKALGQAVGLTPTKVREQAREGGATIIGSDVTTVSNVAAGRDVTITGGQRKARKKKGGK